MQEVCKKNTKKAEIIIIALNIVSKRDFMP